MPRSWRHRGIRRRYPRPADEQAAPVARVQFVTTPGGQELAVMSRSDYERLVAAAELDVVGDIVAPTGIQVSTPGVPHEGKCQGVGPDSASVRQVSTEN